MQTMQGSEKREVRRDGEKKKSLHDIILEFLHEAGGWVNGGSIERLAMDHGYKASNASRRMREMHDDKLVEREERPGETRRIKTVWYKLKEGAYIKI